MPFPVYGKDYNVSDWLFVKDYAIVIDVIIHGGKFAETYNIGGFNEWKSSGLRRDKFKGLESLVTTKAIVSTT